MSIHGVPLDLTVVTTPSYIQAGREDHIAPAESVWKLTHHFGGRNRFVLAGSGHIAGVVNPPAAGKYQYWTNDAAPAMLDEFVAGATTSRLLMSAPRPMGYIGRSPEGTRAGLGRPGARLAHSSPRSFGSSASRKASVNSENAVTKTAMKAVAAASCHQ